MLEQTNKIEVLAKGATARGSNQAHFDWPIMMMIYFDPKKKERKKMFAKIALAKIAAKDR